MNTNSFLQVLSGKLHSALPHLFPTRPAVTDVRDILSIMYETVIAIVATGTDVRIPKFGYFYPKVLKLKVKQGYNVKLGWTSHGQVDSWLTKSMGGMIERIKKCAQ